MDILDEFFKYRESVESKDDSAKIQEGVGDLPAGYTDEDLAEFLDKEQTVPPVADEDEPYDPNDEIIQFVYKDPTDEVQNKINNTFDGGYVENSSMATIGEFRNFVCENELDVDDFRIFDVKGEEYHDKLALVYDIVPKLQEDCETPGCNHCANCGADLDASNFGGHENGEDFCKDCWSWQKSDLDESKGTPKNRIKEAIIAGAGGLVYSSDRTSGAKEDAADALLRKLGKLPMNESREHEPDEKEAEAFYKTFYDLLDIHPDGDPYWLESADSGDGIAFLKDWKKTHPNTTITEDDAVAYFENFINDRLDN